MLEIKFFSSDSSNVTFCDIVSLESRYERPSESIPKLEFILYFVAVSFVVQYS